MARTDDRYALTIEPVVEEQPTDSLSTCTLRFDGPQGVLARAELLRTLENIVRPSALKRGGAIETTLSAKVSGVRRLGRKTLKAPPRRRASPQVLVSELKQLIAAPAPRQAPRQSEWAAVHQALGTRLPPDYQAYVDAFGGSVLGGELAVFSPFSKNKHLELRSNLAATKRLVQALNRSGASHPLLRTHGSSVFPEQGGYLPWGRIMNEELVWITGGDPKTWPTALVNWRDDLWMPLDQPFAEVVRMMLVGDPYIAQFYDEDPLQRVVAYEADA